MEKIISSIFKIYQAELEAEIERAEALLNIKRIYDSGKVLEVAFKNIMLRNLPSYVGITRGIIFDTKVEGQSKEIDMIFYDKRYFNGFEINSMGEDELSLISIDTVFGAISVKKTLTKSALLDCIDNISSVLELERASIRNQYHYDLDLGGIKYDNGEEQNMIFTGIVAYRDKFICSKNKEGEAKFNEDLKQIVSGDFRLDFIYSLDGMFCFPAHIPVGSNKAQMNLSLKSLGVKKSVASITSSNVLNTRDRGLFFSMINEIQKPERAIGLLIFSLNTYMKRMIRTSPNPQNLLQKLLSRSEIHLLSEIEEE